MVTVLTPENIRKFGGLTPQREDQKNGICMALYGTGGSGKTTTLAECVFSKYGNPAALFDVEGGSTAVQHLKKEGLEIYSPTTWKDINNAVNDVKRGNHGYKAVIFDNLSEIVSLCMLDISGGQQPQIQHWGLMTSRIQGMIRDLRDVSRTTDISVFFVLWEEVEKDELTMITRKKVMLTPKLGAAFPGMVPQVGRLSVPRKYKGVRHLSFAPTEDTDAKYRVSPSDAAAEIPLDVYLRVGTHFVADFMDAVIGGVPFPVEKYKEPA